MHPNLSSTTEFPPLSNNTEQPNNRPFLSNVSALTKTNEILPATPIDSPVTSLATQEAVGITEKGEAVMMIGPTKELFPIAPSEPTPSFAQSTQQPLDKAQIPTRHPKIQVWELKVVKPIVLIGDSNLARIPQYNNPYVQVDSFPGANFLHIARVLQKLSPNSNTQKVILLVGLNNSEQLFQQTSKKQLQELWRAATAVFPNASIHSNNLLL